MVKARDVFPALCLCGVSYVRTAFSIAGWDVVNLRICLLRMRQLLVSFISVKT